MKTRSNSLKRFLSWALCICMVLALVPAINLTANATASGKLYLKPNSNWTSSSAWFAAYFFNNGEKWVKMTDADGNGIYECDAPSGFVDVIFCRMNSSASAMNWGNVWNQTSDLKIEDGNDLYTIASGAWNKGGGSWSVATCNQVFHIMSGDKCARCGEEGRTVYFQNNWEWQNVKIYYWKGNLNNGWPGYDATYFGEAVVGGTTRYYSVMTIPADVEGFIINGTNNQNGKQDQTVTLTLDDWHDGITYYIDSYTTESDGHHVCEVTDFLICKDFANEHKYVDDVCTRCEETYCQVNGHKFGSGLGENNECERCGAPSITIFFKSTWGWSDVRLYDWCEGTDINNGWPGTKMNLHTSTQSSGTPITYYYLKVPTDIDDIILNGIKNDDSGERDQSPNIPITELYHGVCIEMSWDVENAKNSYNLFDINEVYPCILGHSFGETTYTWAEDYSTCTATRSCTACVKKTDTETVNAVETVVQAGTCVAPTLVRYDADFDKDINWAADQNATRELEKNPDNHDDTYGQYIEDNQDGTHTEIWGCCEQPAKEPEAHFDVVTDGRCDICNALMAPAQLRNASVSLKGNIGVNYYMLLSEEVAADETAYMQFTLKDGEVRKVYVSEDLRKEIDGEIYYVFSCDMSAKEMSDEIICQFFYGDNCTDAYPYSIQTYANNILAKFDDADTRNLIIAMLNYGAAAQLHFGYNTENLANSILDEAPDYSNVTVDGFSVTVGQGTANATFYSASLILKSETTVRFFFKGKIVSASYNGQELAVSTRNGLYYVDVVGISAKNLNEKVTITINDGTNTADVHFNPMSYCQSVQNDNSGSFTAEMKDLVCALYLYNYAANVYFKEV